MSSPESPRLLSCSRALNEALAQEMRRDPRVVLWGEDIADPFGGSFAVTKGLSAEFGSARVRNVPITEAATAGAAVGAALGGLRPVVELQFAGFALIAGDEILHKAAKWRYMHGAAGDMRLPLVLRLPGGGYMRAGPEHSVFPVAMLAHQPGLVVAVPGGAYDAKGLMIQAIRDDNPVVFLEHVRLYRIKGEVPEEPYTIPFGVAAVRREGTDCTVVAIGYMVELALQAADFLAVQGIRVEVIDPRTLRPLDLETIVASAGRTGRAVIVEEENPMFGVGAEIAAAIAYSLHGHLQAPVERVGSLEVPIPFSPPLEEAVLPSVGRIVDAVARACDTKVDQGDFGPDTATPPPLRYAQT